MAKRVEKTNEIKCLVQILEPELPNLFELEEGDVFYSQRLELLIVISEISNFINFYVNGERKKYKPKSFRAYLTSVSAIPSHKVSLEKFSVN